MNHKSKLMTRDNFREAVFERDGHTCVFCSSPAQDAHHIVERRLWSDGGYYLLNGASVCGEHHLQCETTELSVEAVREACGITKILVPDHLYADQRIDKWGNPILTNGQRIRGELFADASVQKILAQGGFLADFTEWVKYPRTHHLPWSENVNSDDRVISDLSAFIGRRVIVTEKMDGENTNLYPNYLHARSVDGRSHPSRNWVKGFWSRMCQDIPPGWRVCGENLFAEHSIAYTELSTYFMGFSLWDSRNVCLDWDTTVEWFELMGVTSVPVLYDGIYDEKLIQNLSKRSNWADCEGYVVRLADEISYGEFKTKVAKFVRKEHIQTVKHWMHGQAIKPNKLAVG